ncbi:MAG TPA: NAD(P)-dependent alcohol dehydrogenase [Vicinamibacterales bacterium]|nr:NAD(P)-dependent alcohol dehydrogenase [Vicinamibacterales bacterium]
MKAVICAAYGPPEVLRVVEVATPVPRRGQVRIRIRASAVTASDGIIRALKGARRSRILIRLVFGYRAPRRIMGMVLAGEIDFVGPGVTAFRAGDPVFGMNGWAGGACAEYVCWSAKSLIARRPANLSVEEAAALPYGGLLAMFFLKRAGLQPGKRILIYGASGAIGTAAVQLARHAGLRVTGVCSTTNLELVRTLGAEAAIDYTREDFTRRSERYDLVFDAVGRRKSASAMANARVVLAPEGKVLSVDDVLPRPKREDLERLRQLAEQGAIRPVIDRTYPLADIVDAHRYVDEGHKKGNVIVRV